MPIASPIINTSVWSASAAGDTRKKYASVMWKRDREVMIVFPDMRAILNERYYSGQKVEGEEKVGSYVLSLCSFMRLTRQLITRQGQVEGQEARSKRSLAEGTKL